MAGSGSTPGGRGTGSSGDGTQPGLGIPARPPNAQPGRARPSGPPSGQPGRARPVGPPAGQPGQPGRAGTGRSTIRPTGTGARPPVGGPNGQGGQTVATGATGVFPAAYVARPDQAPPGGYSPEPGRRRPSPPPPKGRRLIDYPRWGRTGWTRWLPSWKLVGAIFATGILLVFIGLFAAYSAIKLPTQASAAALAETSVIYFNDGKTPIAQLSNETRESVDLKDVPVPVQNAVLAAEDHTFRTNSGIDPTSIIRAAWSNVRGNSLQGGSTISQQYVKNLYDQRDLSYKRKIKEVFLAVKVNRQVSKDEILEGYLNTIYWGRGANGIQAAAHAYFGQDKKVQDLSVSQGAFLAGIINAPSLADPRGGKEELARAQRRWNVVLDAMVAENWLSSTERQTLKFPKTIQKTGLVAVNSQNGFLKDMVVKEAVQQLHISEDDLTTGGYKITTTFNRRLVKAGAAAVKKMLPAAKDRPKGLNIGMASVDPTTGAVRAIFGGPKYLGSENNNATISTAQAGSTFKAFGLIAALEDGVSLKTEYNSDSPVKIGKFTFGNTDDGESSGYQDLVVATKLSLNTVFAQLNDDLGPLKTEAAAYKAGIPKDVEIGGNLSNILGTASPTALDMAGAYGTFAAEGVRRTPYVIQRVITVGDNKLIFDKKKRDGTKGTRVFKQDNVADLTYAMEQVVKGGTGTNAALGDRPVAGKTGTSSNHRSAWFVGYTPQLSTSVMMYQVGTEKVNGKKVPSNLQMKGFGQFSSIFGGGYPALIWNDYMKVAMSGRDVEQFPDPVYGGEITNRAPATVAPTQPTQPTGQPTTAPTTTQPTAPATTEPAPTRTIELPDPTQPTRPTVDPTDPGDDGDDDQ